MGYGEEITDVREADRRVPMRCIQQAKKRGGDAGKKDASKKDASKKGFTSYKARQAGGTRTTRRQRMILPVLSA